MTSNYEFCMTKGSWIDNNNLVILLRDNIGSNQGELGDGDKQKDLRYFQEVKSTDQGYRYIISFSNN